MTENDARPLRHRAAATLTADTARDLWSAFPYIAELPSPDRGQFLTRLAATIDDEHGGTVDAPRLTVIYTAVRTSA